jgi:hypothetical protein
MPVAIIIKDAFSPTLEQEIREEGVIVPEGSTVWDFLQRRFPGFMEFAEVTTCQISTPKGGRRELLRKDWQTYKLAKDEIAIFLTHPGASVVIAIIVALIVAIAFYLFMDIPTPSDEGQPEADPVYSFKGQGNQSKPGESIEKHYGHVRHWPSYAARPYNKFIDQDQYLFALFCIGLGDYEVTDIMVDDTPIAELQDTVVEIYAPGEEVKMFETNVITAPEVVNLELIGPNEPDYDWSGWYTLNPAGTKCYRIEFDVAFRQGLYRLNDKGKKKGVSVTSQFQYQEIDDDGNPIGEPMVALNFNKSAAVESALRYTVEKVVIPARYRVRGRRTSNAANNYKTRDQLHWEGLRAYCESKQNWGNVTLMAFRAKATNNLNDQSRTKVNVRLQTWTDRWVAEGSKWVPTLTRNPFWAMTDILRADYGRGLPTTFMDTDELLYLANLADAKGITFDWTFDTANTIWPAIQTCLQVARSKPIIPHGIFSAVMDLPATQAKIGFNSTNIATDSFVSTTNLSDFGEHDGIEVEYINPLTWKKETVMCLLDLDQGLNPQTIRLSGCTDRNHAYRFGLYTRATQIYQPDNIEITTGIEAGTASYGTVAAIQHDLLPVDYDISSHNSGILKHTSLSNALGNTRITLPKVPFWERDDMDNLLTHRIALRDRSGTVRGPYVCTPVPDLPKIIQLAVALDLEEFEVDQYSEPPRFWFGATGKEMIWHKIIKIEPAGKDSAKITLVPYSDEIYQHDDAIAPPIDVINEPPTIPTAPIINGLDVNMVPDDLEQVLASWNPALGATSYNVEISLDGETYTFLANTTAASIRLDIPDENYIYVRVSGVGQFVGPWAYWEGEVSMPEVPPSKITGLRIDGNANGATILFQWDADPMAEEYTIVFLIGANILGTYTTTTPAFAYLGSQAQADADESGETLAGTFNAYVFATNALDDGPNSDPLSVVNSIPTDPARNAVTNIVPTPTGYRTLRVGFTQPNSDIKKIEVLVGAANTVPSGVEGTGWFQYEASLPANTCNVLFPTGWAAAWIKFRTYDLWGNMKESAAQRIYPAWP